MINLDTIKMAKNMELESSLGPMDPGSKEILLKTSSKGKGSLSGRTKKPMKVNGKIAK